MPDDVVVPREVERKIRLLHPAEEHDARIEEARGYYRTLRDDRKKELKAQRTPVSVEPAAPQPTAAQAEKILVRKRRKKFRKRKVVVNPGWGPGKDVGTAIEGVGEPVPPPAPVAKSIRLPDKSIVRFRLKKNPPLPAHATDDYSRAYYDTSRIVARRKGQTVGTMGLYRRDVGTQAEHGAMHHKARTVSDLMVAEEHERKGIATGMWQHAKQRKLEPKHSHVQTDAGKAWSAKVGKSDRKRLRRLA
jgi:GNAT superfamily N-acetyltransferase